MGLFRTGAGLLGVCLATAAVAEPVTLTARGTGFTVTGELLEFDGARYIIASPIGRLTIPASETDCAGAACPPPPPAGGAVRIAGGGALAALLAPALVEAMAFAAGGTAERTPQAPDGALRLLAPFGGAEPAEYVIDPFGDPAGASIVLAAEAGEGATLAHDALVLLVSPGSPVASLSLADAGRILSGAATDWSDVGGPPGRIALHLPESGPEAEAMAAFLPGGAAPASGAIRHASLRDLSDAVARDPAALGFATLAFERSARALPLETECGVPAQADRFAVKAGDYPFVRPLAARPGGPLSPAAQAFLDFAASETGQAEIATLGAVDDRLETLGLNAQGARIATGFLKARAPAASTLMAEFAASIVAAERLSATIRFSEGDASLPPESRSKLAALAEAAAEGAFAGREILVIGFADDADGFASGVALSVRRAEAAEAALRRALSAAGAGPVLTRTSGYGPLAPVSCPGPGGRRVEFWVRPAARP